MPSQLAFDSSFFDWLTYLAVIAVAVLLLVAFNLHWLWLGFAVAATAMRQILANHAREQQRQKRGGGASKVELDSTALVASEHTKTVLDVDEALERLALLDARKARIVELKYFGGLQEDEIADVLKVSAITVRRDWRFAKAWLYTELRRVA